MWCDFLYLCVLIAADCSQPFSTFKIAGSHNSYRASKFEYNKTGHQKLLYWEVNAGPRIGLRIMFFRNINSCGEGLFGAPEKKWGCYTSFRYFSGQYQFLWNYSESSSAMILHSVLMSPNASKRIDLIRLTNRALGDYDCVPLQNLLKALIHLTR